MNEFGADGARTLGARGAAADREEPEGRMWCHWEGGGGGKGGGSPFAPKGAEGGGGGEGGKFSTMLPPPIPTECLRRGPLPWGEACPSCLRFNGDATESIRGRGVVGGLRSPR